MNPVSDEEEEQGADTAGLYRIHYDPSMNPVSDEEEELGADTAGLYRIHYDPSASRLVLHLLSLLTLEGSCNSKQLCPCTFFPQA